METFIQIIGSALIAACCCILLRGQAGVLAMLLSLAACIFIYSISLQLFYPVMELLHKIQNMTKLEPVVTSPVLKVVGIGFVSQIASAVCEDSGEKALGQAVEIACAILALYVSIPLISAVLDLLENMLRGTG